MGKGGVDLHRWAMRVAGYKEPWLQGGGDACFVLYLHGFCVFVYFFSVKIAPFHQSRKWLFVFLCIAAVLLRSSGCFFPPAGKMKPYASSRQD